MSDGAPPGRIRRRDRDAVLQSLRAGVVPRVGQQHIQVGRVGEVGALVSDIARIVDGGAAVRFVIGEYGAGKSFFLHLVRAVALERRLVTVHADLAPDRRLRSTRGQARALYADLARNLATRSRPAGGALGTVVERFVADSVKEADGGDAEATDVIRRRLSPLEDMAGGYEFAAVLAAYWRGHDGGDDRVKAAALRWLRGEYATRTDARADLGVRTIIDDSAMFDHLKLLATLVRIAGFGGLLVCLDEMVNLYKLANGRSRDANYEVVLHIVNECLQGTVEGLGFVFAGTPDMLMDTRRGLYSYEALRSRLAENTWARGGIVDFSGPVLRLANLTAEDMFVLLAKVRDVYASGDESAYLLPDDGLGAFMAHCESRIGDSYFRTPRTTIRAFVNFLSVLEQNPDVSWEDLVSDVGVERDQGPDRTRPAPSPGGGDGGGEGGGDDPPGGGELAELRL